MAALTGNKIKDSYLGLLKSISNGVISSSFVQISDGGGNALPLYLSTSSIKFYNAYTFPSADGTISGQVLSTDASGTLSWVTSSDNQTLQEVLTQGNTTDLEITTTAQFNGDINGALLQKVIAAEALSKGDVVYISGGTGANPEVSKAKADSSTTMPALGIMKEPLSLNAEGECITSGELTGLNLSSSGTIGDFDTGDELFVSSTTAGGLVDTAPTGEANLIQKIGKVIKGQTGGALTVLGAFRTNAVPNLNSAKIFLGNASNQAVSTAISGDATISDTGVIALATVPVTKGGTGATTLTGILLGNGTSAISGITSAVDGHVLTADGVGGYAFEGLPVKKTGTITVDELAVFDNADGTLRSDSTISIDSSGNITFDQGTNNYLIGGGNIAGNVGSGNVGLGHNVLTSQTSGNNNIAIGFGVLDAFVTGASNIALGDNSMGASTGGTRNIAIGKNALQNGAGSYNLAIGDSSMSSGNLSGLQNTCVGYTSGNSLTSGGNNLFIGNGAGSSVTTVSNNVILGSNNGSTITDNNNIIISDGGGNNRIQVDSGGDATFSGNVTITQPTNGSDAILNLTAKSSSGNSRTSSLTYDADTENLIVNNAGTNALTISSGGIVGIGSTGIFAGTNAILNLQGSGIALKNDRNGSNNNWSYIQNDGTGNESTIILSTGNAVPAMKLAHNGNVGIGISPTAGKLQVNNGTDLNVAFNTSVVDSTTTSRISSVNDAVSAGVGLVIQGTPLVFNNNAGEAMRITSGGDVKIGDSTTDVTSKLTVSGNGSVNTATFMYDGNAGTYFDIDTEAANGSVILTADARSGNYPPMLFKTGGSTRLTISSGGVATFSNYIDTPEVRQGGEFMIGRSSNIIRVGSGDGSDSLAFYAGASQAMSITTGGNVGIGTDSPDTTGFGWNVLTIQGGSSAGEAGVLELKTGSANSVNDNLGIIAFLNGSTRVAQIDSISEGSNNTSAINFYTHNNTSMEKRLSISSVGNATLNGYLQLGTSASQTILGDFGETNTYLINYNSGGTLKFLIGGGAASNEKLTISSGGAATFMGGTVVDYVTNVCRFYGNVSTNTFALGANNTMYYQGDASQFYPTIDNTRALGTGSYRYTTVYASNGSINTSDFREKTEIKPTKLGLDFINDLKPISYKWIDGKRHIGKETIKDERNHQGLIAQEIAETLEKHGINKNDFGGLDIQKTNKYDDFYGMAYSQLIAPMIKAIQEQQTIIEDLKSRIETLEG